MKKQCTLIRINKLSVTEKEYHMFGDKHVSAFFTFYVSLMLSKLFRNMAVLINGPNDDKINGKVQESSIATYCSNKK